MIEPQDLTVVCDECGRGVRFAGIDGSLGDLVRGVREEGWTLGETDRCPDHDSTGTLSGACGVGWCVRGEPGHIEHRAGMKVVQGAVAAGMDFAEHEGQLLNVGLQSETDEARLGVAIVGMEQTATVRLSPEATVYVRDLLRTAIGD